MIVSLLLALFAQTPPVGSQPSYSPDGELVAYRDENGLHLLSTKGGKPRLLAKNGSRPKIAPIGKQIAWSAANTLFVYRLTENRARPVPTGSLKAHDPIWSPDGKHLLFVGCKETCDWWISPAEGGDPIAVSAALHFRQLHIDPIPSPDLWLADKNTILFTGRVGENTRVWSLQLNASGWRVNAPPKRVTSGTADERFPTAMPDGRIAYTSRTQNIDVYTLPLQADTARVKGSLTRLTSDASLDQRPSLSRDGKRIAWETSRGGNFEVWVKDLATGKEQAITTGPLREHMPALAPDGSALVYDAHDGEKVTVFRSPFEGGAPTNIHEENVGQGSFQWTTQPDTVLYFYREPPGTVGLFNLTTRQRTVLLRHTKLNLSLSDARLSPDRRWIAFPVPFAPHRSRLAIAPTNEAANENNWTYLLPDTYNSSQPEWSPNGKWLYFLSDETGTLAVHAIAIQNNGKPAGSPKPILQLAGPRLSINELRPRDIGLAVATDKLALAVAEYTNSLESLPLLQ